jgi:hypothetical protein
MEMPACLGVAFASVLQSRAIRRERRALEIQVYVPVSLKAFEDAEDNRRH